MYQQPELQASIALSVSEAKWKVAFQTRAVVASGDEQELSASGQKGEVVEGGWRSWTGPVVVEGSSKQILRRVSQRSG